MGYTKSNISIVQILQSGNNFTGVEPDKESTTQGAHLVYENLTQGGFFEFDNDAETLSIKEIRFDFADASTWRIDVTNTDTGKTWTVLDDSDYSGDTNIFDTSRQFFHLRYNDELRLYTENATKEIYANIIVGRWS